MRVNQPPDLDADMRSVIDAARGGHEPNEMARARVRRGLEVKLAAGVAVAVGPTASAFASAFKVTAAVVAVGAAVTAGVYVAPHYMSKQKAAHAPAAHVVNRTAPVVAAAPPQGELETDVPVPVVAPAPRTHVRHRAPVAAPPPPPVENVSSLKEETALLGAANAALARGDTKRTQTLLEEYDHRPGSGLLAEERTVTGILASCAAGHVDAARAEARHFHARWPRSPLAARVDGSCAGSAAENP